MRYRNGRYSETDVQGHEWYAVAGLVVMNQLRTNSESRSDSSGKLENVPSRRQRNRKGVPRMETPHPEPKRVLQLVESETEAQDE